MADSQSTNRINYERLYGTDQRYSLMITLPMKLALEEMAKRMHMSAAAIVRQTILHYADNVAPGFNQVYQRFMEENANQK